ncbi:MAG TPA: Pr6Pr family membrane protein, partial [Catenuloplanes sp.]
MKLRDPRLVMVLRVAIVVSALTGIIFTALGPPTILGLLPYFTIQSNLAVALFAAYATGRARRGDVEPSPVLQGAVTLYITITGLVYHLVLANPASPFAMAQPDRDWVSATGNQLLHT